MKNILIFTTIAGIAMVVAYYLLIEKGGKSKGVSAFESY